MARERAQQAVGISRARLRSSGAKLAMKKWGSTSTSGFLLRLPSGWEIMFFVPAPWEPGVEELPCILKYHRKNIRPFFSPPTTLSQLSPPLCAGRHPQHGTKNKFCPRMPLLFGPAAGRGAARGGARARIPPADVPRVLCAGSRARERQEAAVLAQQRAALARGAPACAQKCWCRDKTHGGCHLACYRATGGI